MCLFIPRLPERSASREANQASSSLIVNWALCSENTHLPFLKRHCNWTRHTSRSVGMRLDSLFPSVSLLNTSGTVDLTVLIKVLHRCMVHVVRYYFDQFSRWNP